MPNSHTRDEKTGAEMPGTAEDQRAADFLLRNYPLTLSDTVRLIIELLEGSRDVNATSAETVLSHCRRVICLGLEAYDLSRQTVSFKDAVSSLLIYKNTVRERTLREIRQICQRVMTCDPEWSDKMMRQVSTEMCQRTLMRVFHTIPMQRKARRILHAVFSYAILNGWCTVNPLDLVVLPPHSERTIRALSVSEVKALLRVAEKPEYRECAAALGLMLWAGIRPNEVMRLHYRDIDFEDRVITVPPNHSKTGGSRQVIMYPALYYWLRRHVEVIVPEARVVPRSWNVKWLKMRTEAGFTDWVPDILRHTFASYHLKYFRDINVLLMDMGHATPQLLRTRYLAMQNVTRHSAKLFWEYGVPASPK